MRALLISVATLVVFDAIAWQGAMRHRVIAEVIAGAATISGLDWSWG